MAKYSTDILPNKEAIIHFKGKTLLTSQSYLDVKAYEHALAFTVAKMMDEDLLKETRDAILSAMENGTDFRDFKRTLMPYLMAKGWLAPSFKNDNIDDDKETFKAYQKHLGRRLRTIFHTNMHSSYSAGQWQRIQQTKEFLPYLQYMPSLSAKKRDNHTRYYGLLRPVDDPIWQSIFPPNGYGCKCWVKQLTRKQAEKIQFQQAKDVSNGKADRFELEMETVENPRTGEKMTTPKGVHFSFAHNYDRLTALLKLAEDKHGTEFGERLKLQLDTFMLDMAKQANITIADFTGIVARHVEYQRLLVDLLDNKEKPHEAMAGEQYQQYYSVHLERPKAEMNEDGTPKAGFDYWITNTGEKLDFMYTMHGYNAFKIGKLNEFFNKTSDHWQKQVDDILYHLEKTHVVPLDLRYLTTENRVKLISFLLSLNEQQKKQIILIIGKV